MFFPHETWLYRLTFQWGAKSPTRKWRKCTSKAPPLIQWHPAFQQHSLHYSHSYTQVLALTLDPLKRFTLVEMFSHYRCTVQFDFLQVLSLSKLLNPKTFNKCFMEKTNTFLKRGRGGKMAQCLIKSIYCSSKGPGFDFLHTYDSWHRLWLQLLLPTMNISHTGSHTYIYASKTLIQIKNKSKTIN